MTDKTLHEQFKIFMQECRDAHFQFLAASNCFVVDAPVSDDEYDRTYLKMREAETHLDITQTALCAFLEKNCDHIRFE